MSQVLDHHGRRLEHRHGDLSHRQLLMIRLLSRDHRSVGSQHEVDAGVWHQVGLELRDVNIQGTVEAKAGRERADDLGNQAVQIGVSRPLNVQVASTNVVQGLIVLRRSAMLTEISKSDHATACQQEGCQN